MLFTTTAVWAMKKEKSSRFNPHNNNQYFVYFATETGCFTDYKHIRLYIARTVSTGTETDPWKTVWQGFFNRRLLHVFFFSHVFLVLNQFLLYVRL